MVLLALIDVTSNFDNLLVFFQPVVVSLTIKSVTISVDSVCVRQIRLDRHVTSVWPITGAGIVSQVVR